MENAEGTERILFYFILFLYVYDWAVVQSLFLMDIFRMLLFIAEENLLRD